MIPLLSKVVLNYITTRKCW